MKKFIAPEVKVVRYDSSILCTSIGVGDDLTPGEGEVIGDAPGRRRSIFDEGSTEVKTGRL